MRPQKAIKIDLTNEYPCPCRRRGRLMPIILTEAFGCDRCQQIFVVQENNQVIEQLSSSYPYKRMWRWTGFRWVTVHPRLGESYLSVAVGIILLLLFIWLPLVLRSPAGVSMIFWIGIAVLVLLLPAILFWLARAR